MESLPKLAAEAEGHREEAAQQSLVHFFLETAGKP